MRFGFLAAAIMFASTAVSAEEGRLQAGLKASTLGLGAEVGYRFNDLVGLRGDLNYYTREFDREISGLDYGAELNSFNAGLLADFYPMKGAFRLSGGLRYNGNQIDLSARPTQSVEIGGTTYTPSQVGAIGAEVDFDRIAPYFGIGFAPQINENMVLSLDAGVMFQGGANLSRIRTSENSAVSRLDLERERQELQDKIDDYKYYPVLSVGLSYRF